MRTHNDKQRAQLILTHYAGVRFARNPGDSELEEVIPIGRAKGCDAALHMNPKDKSRCSPAVLFSVAVQNAHGSASC